MEWDWRCLSGKDHLLLQRGALVVETICCCRGGALVVETICWCRGLEFGFQPNSGDSPAHESSSRGPMPRPLKAPAAVCTVPTQAHRHRVKNNKNKSYKIGDDEISKRHMWCVHHRVEECRS